MNQEPFPVVLRDANGKVIAANGERSEKLEEELPIVRGPHKR